MCRCIFCFTFWCDTPINLIEKDDEQTMTTRHTTNTHYDGRNTFPSTTFLTDFFFFHRRLYQFNSSLMFTKTHSYNVTRNTRNTRNSEYSLRLTRTYSCTTTRSLMVTRHCGHLSTLGAHAWHSWCPHGTSTIVLGASMHTPQHLAWSAGSKTLANFRC
jgi:hypothetical protein